MKTKAIYHSRNLVGELYRFGDNYKFNWFDESVKSWRESISLPYHQAMSHRSQTLIDLAQEYLKLGYVQYDGGKWERYVGK